jgi:hypothetical protein
MMTGKLPLILHSSFRIHHYLDRPENDLPRLAPVAKRVEGL